MPVVLHRSDTWSLILGENKTLQDYMNQVLGRKFRPKKNVIKEDKGSNA
jgi:hypothetical protein